MVGVRLPGRSVGNLLNNSNFSLTLCQQANQLSIVLLCWLGLIQKRRPSAGTSPSFRSRKRFLQGNANAFTVELVNALRRRHVDKLGQRPVRFCLQAVTPQRKRTSKTNGAPLSEFPPRSANIRPRPLKPNVASYTPKINPICQQKP